MKKKPDINDFIEGGGLSEVFAKNLGIPQSEMYVKVHREQKIVRLPADLINDLKRACLEQSIKEGRRVTEASMVEQALKEYLYK